MQEPELVSLTGFTACGISTRTSREVESDPVRALVPKLWRRFYADGMAARLGANSANGRVVAVYSSYENAALGRYLVTVGVHMNRECDSAGDLVHAAVSTGEYLRFGAYGAGPVAVARTWEGIDEFFAHAEHALAGKYERAYTADFERYGDPERVSIFIAVKRKLGVHVASERIRRALRQI